MRCMCVVAATAACLVGFNGTPAWAAGEKITVAGSSTVRPIVEEAAKQFKQTHPDVSFVVGGGGSSHGVKMAGSEEVVLGMASRGLKDSEKQQWSDLVPITIGRDGIALIVNSKNPLNAITKQQVQDIYTGKITNWKELGGDDAPIALVSKEEGRSTLELFLKYFDLEGKESATSMVHRVKGSEEYSTVEAKLIGPNREALAAASVKKNVIAYVSVGTAQEVAHKGGRVKLLDLDGVQATIENVARETYPLRRPLNIVTKGPADGVAKEFIDFLTNEQGQEIIRGLEFISLQEEI